MKIIETVREMEAERARLPGSAGLVPTMGALHEGHLSLVRRARADNDFAVVSIFVNPTQFGPNEDYQSYPRDRERDLALLEAEGVDVVFMPGEEEMYPPGFDEWVEVPGPLTSRLEGVARPGHFCGVATVVARLFRIVRPQRAYFGQKDAQQVRVIRRMVSDLGLPVEIVPMPIVRDADGLALSSRNAYLSPAERRAALVLPRALDLARMMALGWGIREADLLRESLEDYIRQVPQVRLDYVSIADEDTLEELHDTIEGPALVLLAARVGTTRLIDNTVIAPEGADVPDALRDIIDDIKAGRSRSST